MVGAAVLGAAAGSGIALVLGLSVVIYKYYYRRRKTLEWEYLLKRPASPQMHDSTKRNFTPTKTEFNVVKEHIVQPPRNASSQTHISAIMRGPLDVCNAPSQVPPLQHQSKSYPGGHPALCRTPSVTSQSSVESAPSRHGHRGSSPQIRTFAPDGRTVNHEGTQCSSPRHSSSRSPSPLRAASLDIRSSSPGNSLGELRTPSPSQASLVSITSSTCSSPNNISPKAANTARCLSPLLIPSRACTPDANAPLPPASPLGAIQPDLYTRKDGPMFITKVPNHGPDLGRLHFRLKYDFDRSDLIVHLIEAHDLAGSERGGFNDPFVRVSISPEIDTRKRQTVIHRNDANPYFDQHFKFPVSHEELQAKTLVLQVFDFDRFSRNDVIGEVRMTMEEFDVTSSMEVWGDISRIKKPPEDLQEVLVSLSYLPSAERLTVVLLRARNLFQHEDKESIDPFVKVYLLINGKRSKKKKTAVKKCCNPSWNEALTFTLSASNLPNTAIEICVMDQSNDLIGTSPILGSVVIGPRESGSERDHWVEFTKSPRNTVACWHTLR